MLLHRLYCCIGCNCRTADTGFVWAPHSDGPACTARLAHPIATSLHFNVSLSLSLSLFVGKCRLLQSEVRACVPLFWSVWLPIHLERPLDRLFIDACFFVNIFCCCFSSIKLHLSQSIGFQSASDAHLFILFVIKSYSKYR